MVCTQVAKNVAAINSHEHLYDKPKHTGIFRSTGTETTGRVTGGSIVGAGATCSGEPARAPAELLRQSRSRTTRPCQTARAVEFVSRCFICPTTTKTSQPVLVLPESQYVSPHRARQCWHFWLRVVGSPFSMIKFCCCTAGCFDCLCSQLQCVLPEFALWHRLAQGGLSCGPSIKVVACEWCWHWVVMARGPPQHFRVERTCLGNETVGGSARITASAN